MNETLDEHINRLFPDVAGEQMPLAAPVIHHVSHSPGMMSKTLRPAIKCHGGKFYLSHHILSISAAVMANAAVKKELFGGGGNWLIQSQRSSGQLEIYNEYDPLIWNVYNSLSRSGRAVNLLDRLQQIGCRDQLEMQAEWEASKQVCLTMYGQERRSLIQLLSENDDAAVGLAAASIVYRRMSSGGMGKVFSWQDRLRGGQAGEINSWKTFVWRHAPLLAQRCASWVCICQDGLTLMQPDAPDGGMMDEHTIFYLDPPYLKETRTAKDVYGSYELANTIEMGPDISDATAHATMLSLCQYAQARIIISSYDNALYNSYLNADCGWTKHLFALPNHSGRGETKQPRVEVVYTNF